MDEANGTVNSQIVDATTSVLAMTAGNSPAQSFAMLDTVLVESLGMAMYNAVNRQQGASMLSSAAVTAACAKMLGVPLPFAAPPVFAPPPPPTIEPLPGPGGHSSDTGSVADTYAKAQDDVNELIQQRAEAQNTVDQVSEDLKNIAKQIGGDGTTTTPTTSGGIDASGGTSPAA